MGSAGQTPPHKKDRHLRVIAEETAIAHSYAQLTTPTERNRAFSILFVSLLCMGAGQSIIYTILPPLGRELGLSPFQTLCIFAVSALIWVFSSAFWGVRSDYWGRKPVMLLGLLAFAVSFFAFATTMLAGLRHWLWVPLIFPLMIASRCIYGTFGSGTSAAAQAYVADRTTPRERLRGVALIGMAFALGTTFGPVIGSALTYIGLLAPFFFISALAVASAASIYFFLPERTPPRIHRQQASRLRWYEPRMFPFVAFGLVLSLIASIPTQTVGFFIEDVLKYDAHATARLTGIGLMAAAMSALFAQFVIVQRFHLSARVLTAAGLILAGLSNALFLVAHDFVVVILALMLSGLGFGMARPSFTSGASLSVEPHEQGAVAGLLSAAGAAGFIFGPMIGWLYEFSPVVPYAFGTVVMLGMIAAQFLSPVLYHAGDIPPDSEAAEELAESTLPNG
ncbi:MAG TPA: MFS transporter [Rhizomicrobium sp.]|jgi:MFS family permease|nr:MFS transporter [Rhizomicrobium sp.]